MNNQFYNKLITNLENASKLSGGPLRQEMGDMVEKLVDDIWEGLCKKYPNVNARIEKGSSNPLTIFDNKGNKIQESVDRHCFINNKLIACVECKTYLDKCFLQRADSDFHLMKMATNFNAIILSLENATSADSFNFFINQNNIDKIFFLADGRRDSKKHISKNRERIKNDYIENFITYLEQYFIKDNPNE